MGLIRKWYEKVDLKAKLKARDEINKTLVIMNDSAGRCIKTLEAERNTLHGITLDLDAQVSDFHERIQRIAVAFKTAPSTKRMSMADKEAILRVVFDVPLQPVEK